MQATRLYTFLSPFLDQIPGLKAMAHITGSGLDNLSRILPKGLKAELNTWPIPSCFLDVKKRAGLTWAELLTTFNCGLGLVLILKNKNKLQALFSNEQLIDLGKVKKRAKNLKSWSLDFQSLNCLHSLNSKKD